MTCGAWAPTKTSLERAGALSLRLFESRNREGGADGIRALAMSPVGERDLWPPNRLLLLAAARS